MTYSRKAITQLNRKYKSVLMKCALINAGLFMVISPAMGDVWNYNGEGEDYGGAVDNPLTKTTNITGNLTFIGSGISSSSILDGGNSVRVFNVAEGVQNAVLAGFYRVQQGSANQGGGLYNSGKISISKPDGGRSGSFTENRATRGGAIYNNGIITDMEVAFSSNSATDNGGAIYNKRTITGNIEGSFSSNSAENWEGGAIYNAYGATINGINARFYSNTANKQGGAIHNEATISSIGGSFDSNSSGVHGGAISNVGVITNINSNFSENTSLKGGAINNYKGRGGYDGWGGEFDQPGEIGTIKGSFTSNKATSGNGGAINNEGDITSIGATFTSNSARGNAGAIYNSGTIGDINNVHASAINGSFEGNEANRGGAIYNKASGLITSLGGSFESNSAGDAGGALFNEKDGDTSGQITILSANFTSNKATNGNGGAVYSNGDIGAVHGAYSQNSANNGGGIYNSGNISYIAIGSNFTSNKATDGNGGAIFNDGTIGDVNDVNANAIGGSFNENVATNNGGAIRNNGRITKIIASFSKNMANNGFGGAIYNANNMTIDSIDGATFSENEAKQGGGALLNEGNITSVNATFSQNKVLNGLGGAILNFKNTISSIAGSFIGNTANRGGAIYNKASGLITNLGGSFTSNSAGDAGGALFNERDGNTSGQITTLSAYFTSNSATNNGGAVYSNGDIGAVSGAYSQNSASNGGGIYNSGNISSIVGNGISFASNTASNNGGAIFNDGTIELINYDFDDNSAVSGNGGAIYNAGNIKEFANRLLKEVAFTGNQANNGGAIYNSGTIGDVSDEDANAISGSFDGNEANRGGAIYNNGIITGINGNFASNSATDNGGAIYNKRTITGNIEGSFSGNSAENWEGGAIYNAYGATINGINASFNNNTAKQQGGVIHNEAEISSIGGSFVSNSSGLHGGAISNVGVITNINSDFSGNTSLKGGAINNYKGIGGYDGWGGGFDQPGEIGTINGSFTSNEATNGNGGAINNEGDITSIGATFTSNSATGNGGAIYNLGTIGSIVNSSFIGNYAINESADAKGGAIYTNKDLSIVANNGTTSFSGNYVEDSNGKRNEAVFVGNANANLTLNASNNGLIRLDDYINGESGYAVDITGDSSGTIELNNDIKNADVSVEKVKIDMSNGNIDTRTFMTLNANNATDNAKWEIDVKFEDSTSDKIVVTNASSGAILVDKLNLVGDVEAKVGETLNFHVLNTQDENIQLALGNEVVTNPIVRDDILYSEEVKENTLWTDTYNRVVGHYEVNGIVGLTKTNTTNDTISFEVERIDYTEKTVLGDTLAMVNNAENLTDKAFNFESENDKYVATDNLGETKGNVTINGVANGDAKSEISLGNYSGFEVGDNTNLSINNTKVVGNGSVLDVRDGGSVNLDNAVLDGLVTNKGEIVAENTVFDGEVKNDGVIDAQDIVLNGDVTNNNNIVAKDMEFGGDVRNDGVIESQKIVLNGDVTNNNSIVAEDMEFGGDVRNDGVIEATNGSIELNGDVSGDGLINVNNSDLIINAKFDDNDITLNGGNISLGDNANINGGNLVVEAGNIDILAKKVNVDSAKFGANSTLALKVDSLSEYGVLNAKDSLEIEEGATLKATLAQGLVGIGKTEEVKLLTSDNDFENNFTDVMENNMYSFVKKEGDTGVYEIRQTKTAQDVIEENGGSSVNQGSASAWVDGDSFENDSVAKDVADKLADMAQNNAKEFDKALTTLAPDLAPVVKSNVIHHGGQVFGAVSNRLSNGGIANGKGMASGDSKVDGGAVWVQTIGNVSTLDGGENSSGFESKTAGVTLGVEKQIDDVKVGVGYAYSQSDIDADNNLREIEVDTHTALMYGEYKPNNWFINTQIAYAFADYDETKRALGSNYMAQYDVETLGVQALTGYDFRICRDKLTPIAGLRYYHIKRDGYMDSAMQYVSSDTMDILTAVLGVKFEGNVRTELGSRFVVRTHANLTYDLITDRDNAYVGLQNGSSYLVKGDSLERLGVEVGGSIGFNLNEAIDISIGYEGRFRDDFQDHTGILSAKYKL